MLDQDRAVELEDDGAAVELGHDRAVSSQFRSLAMMARLSAIMVGGVPSPCCMARSTSPRVHPREYVQQD